MVNLNRGQHDCDQQKSSDQFNNKTQKAAHFRIDWRKLSYTLNKPNPSSSLPTNKNDRKLILNSLDGHFRSGKLSAILGPSGSGKTTMLSCLFGRKQSEAKGETKVTWFEDENHSIPLDEGHLKQVNSKPMKVASLPQDDHLLHNLSVFECLMFASKLRDPKCKDHLSKVRRVIKMMRLLECLEVRCGKLSGGQYKRVSIAQELLSEPHVMIMDEPTTGLDAMTSLSTIQTLKSTLRKSRSHRPLSIIITIHQPDAELFAMLDHVYVLGPSKVGVIYEGPPGDVIETLASVGVASDIFDCNPARLILEICFPGEAKVNARKFDVEEDVNVSANQINQEANSDADGIQLTTIEPEVDESKSDLRKLNEIQRASYADGCTRSVSQTQNQGEQTLERKSWTAKKFDKQLSCKRNTSRGSRSSSLAGFIELSWILTHRTFVSLSRDKTYFASQLFMHIFDPIVIGLLLTTGQDHGCPQVSKFDLVDFYYMGNSNMSSLSTKSMRDTISNTAVVNIQILAICLSINAVSALVFPADMHVLLKEYKNGCYSMANYFFARTLADLPLLMLMHTIAMVLVLTTSGQDMPIAQQLLLVIMVNLGSICAQSVGLATGALLMKKPAAAMVTATAILIPQFSVTGALIRVSALPVWARWVAKFTFLHHLLNGFVILRYGFGKCPTTSSGGEAKVKTHEMPIGAIEPRIVEWLREFEPQHPGANASDTRVMERLLKSIAKAGTYGFEISESRQVKPFAMLEFDLEDQDLASTFAIIMLMVVVLKIISFAIIYLKVRSNL